MRRSPLKRTTSIGPGKLSLTRQSTFKPPTDAPGRKRRAISPASKDGVPPANPVEFGAHKAGPHRANDRPHGTEGIASMQDESIPTGLCQCGCGRKTLVATKTDSTRGIVEGQPQRFLLGHSGTKPSQWRVCEGCGEQFRSRQGRDSRACSPDCARTVRAAKRDAETPSADELRSLYEVGCLTLKGLARHYGKSPTWARAALALRGIPEHPRLSGRDLQCDECGVHFYADPTEIANGRRFCSNPCKFASMGSPAKRPGVGANILAAKRGQRPVNPHTSIRRLWGVRLKGEESCRNCGAAGTGALLSLHHAVPRSMCKAGRLDLRNGITLCQPCHRGWHARTRVLYRDLFTAEEWAFISSLELLGQNIAAWLDDRYPARSSRDVA